MEFSNFFSSVLLDEEIISDDFNSLQTFSNGVGMALFRH